MPNELLAKWLIECADLAEVRKRIHPKETDSPASTGSILLTWPSTSWTLCPATPPTAAWPRSLE
jgi:hypothetical protein